MKWFVLIVIFAVALYQGVTGFPTNILKENMEWLKKINDSRDLETEIANKSPLDINVVILELLKYSPPISLFIEMVDDWTDRIEIIKDLHEPLCHLFENLVRSVDEIQEDVTKDKDTKDQSTFENVSVNKTVHDELFNFTLLQLEFGKLNYKEVIKNLQDIVKYVKSNIIKDKAVKNESTSENVPLDEHRSFLAYILVKMEITKLHKIAMINHIEKVGDYIINVYKRKKNINISIGKDKTKGQGIFGNILNFLNETIMSENPLQEAESLYRFKQHQ